MGSDSYTPDLAGNMRRENTAGMKTDASTSTCGRRTEVGRDECKLKKESERQPREEGHHEELSVQTGADANSEHRTS